MPSSRILIASNTLSSATNTVTFSSIPSTYTDLVLRISCRKDTPGTKGEYIVIFNSTFGSGTRIVATSGVVVADRPSTNLRPNTLQSGGTSNTYDSTEIYIPNYAGSTSKPVSMFNAQEFDNTSDDQLTLVAALFNITSAITTVSIRNGLGVNFVAGSSFFLYGLKNS